MYDDYLSIYAFNDKEKEILSKNKSIINGNVKLSSKDVKVYFYLKKVKGEIGITDLVIKCLTEQGYDVNSDEMFKPRKKPGSNEFYETKAFVGKNDFRVDAFSRSLTKLVKTGLVTKKTIDTSSVYSTTVQE